MNNLYAPMGRRIANLRAKHSMTQEKLAEKLNISIKHCSAVERGTSGLSLEKLVILCDIFDTTLDYVVCGRNPLPPSLEKLLLTEDPNEQKLLQEYLQLFNKIQNL
ncbi:MAG: helix-turn-helix transcriptional regulator [Lachnospiraceae bacterium]|nr:helix-turn-helix transcriptional regulator [Lachnospiraceae bacterium]MDD3617293.1 helix-turn-helix transcriptional regulator [Lachnospiraceae bacterium]